MAAMNVARSFIEISYCSGAGPHVASGRQANLRIVSNVGRRCNSAPAFSRNHGDGSVELLGWPARLQPSLAAPAVLATLLGAMITFRFKSLGRGKRHRHR